MAVYEQAHPHYKVHDTFSIDCGFVVTSADLVAAVDKTSDILKALPFSLYQTIDYKSVSTIIGRVFCEHLADAVGAAVNPIEKGHPDIIPVDGVDSTEEQLRNYPDGLEIKCTIGNVAKGSELAAGQKRIESLTGITWQAHHREVESLMGLVWDFAGEPVARSGQYPIITGAFYSNDLVEEDWGAISGTTGRNTKVSGMRTSGKRKMGAGWIVVLDDRQYLAKYQRLLSFRT